MFDLCTSAADVQLAISNIAIVLTFLSMILGAVTEIVFPDVKSRRYHRVAMHTVCALLMLIPAAYLWVQVVAIAYYPTFSRWLDAVIVGVLC